MSTPLSLAVPNFVWATGIENTFVPQERPGLRALDEYELTQHYQQWKSDFDLVAESGVRAVRWGIPWYRVQPAPDRWDWRWTDKALDYLVNVKGITPILDLMHYGTPLWLDNSFLNAAYPQRVAEYARAVAERYRSIVRFYTPLNEPIINAQMSGWHGQWPPYLCGDDGFVKVLLALAKGIVLTVQAFRSEHPQAVSVQVEALWKFCAHETGLQSRVDEYNAQKYLSLDLTMGRVGEDDLMRRYLQRHGATEADLAWFRENAVSFDVLGANFYPWCHGRKAARKDGTLYRLPGTTSGLIIGEMLSEIHARYHKPIMVTETSARGGVGVRARWMDETIEAVRGLRASGVPIVGYTWFPLFSMLDWDYRPGGRPAEDYLLHLGLYDAAFDSRGVLRRHATPLVARYRAHMSKPMPFGVPLSIPAQPLGLGLTSPLQPSSLGATG